MKAAAWLDGELIEPGAAGISVDDHGFTIGDGVFETLVVRGRRPCFWARHVARLGRSLEATGIRPVDEGVLVRAVGAVVAACDLDDARLRITVSSGPGPGGLRRGPRPTVLVTAGAIASTGGPVAALTVPWARNERSPIAGVKSTSYAEAAALQARIDAAGVDDALLGDTHGRLSEALTANVFVALRGRALTPSRASGCLPGTVRDVLLEAGVAEEADIPLERLVEAEEVFLSSSVAGVRPVRSIDGRALPVVDGPLARAAGEAYRAAEAAEVASGGSWPG